jgi:hypothetical protein
MATEAPEYLRKKTARVFFLRKGAALEGGPECVSDPDAQERYQEVTTGKGMRNALNRWVFRTSSRTRQARLVTETSLSTTV